MAGAPARDRILDAAESLVLRHGFSATTVDAVLAGAGASKGAFFHHFPTKAHLGRALVERYAARDLAALELAIATAETRHDEPGAQLVEMARIFEAGADATVAAQPSCMFVSFIYESDLGGVGTEAIVSETILQWRARIVDKLATAAATRPHVSGEDLEALADHWFATFEGAFLLAQALDDPSQMRRQLGQLRRHLELLLLDR